MFNASVHIYPNKLFINNTSAYRYTDIAKPFHSLVISDFTISAQVSTNHKESPIHTVADVQKLYKYKSGDKHKMHAKLKSANIVVMHQTQYSKFDLHNPNEHIILY